MRSVKGDNTIIILKGDVESAQYKMQELEEYSGNPFIEALPPIFSQDDVMDKLTVSPPINYEDRNRPNNIRYHIIKRLKNFVQPLPIHFTIESRLSTLIRRGYLARNPIDKSYLNRVRILNELRSTNEKLEIRDIEDAMSYVRSTADSMAIIGISGIGKTTAVERILLMYPQVIRHTEYGGDPFSKTQIVWLKIDCPYDGSLSTLCKSFFKAIDDILGTRYLEKYGYTNRVTSSMMLHMTALASIYGIGILVIDEIQQLLNAKNNMDDMLNFFVTLSNTVGIPTVLIGTSKAQELFKGNFRQARRAASEGAIMWDRMAPADIEWDFFIETLWDMQCLKNFTDLTPAIKDAFYDETQGITSVAVNLFILVQERALSEGKEQITIDLIRTTAKEDLKILQPMLKALRSNNLEEIIRYEDISINLEALTINYRRDIELIGKIQESFRERKKDVELHQRDRVESLILDLEQVGIFTELSVSDLKNVITKLVESKPMSTDYNELKKLCIIKALELNDNRKEEKENKPLMKIKREGLLHLYDKSIKTKKHVYDVLMNQGYIKDPRDEFLKVE
jgi:hypothetical protein